MLNTNYDVLVRNGKERFLVIPEKEYHALRDQLEDEADVRIIEASKRKNAGKALIPFEQVKRELAASRRAQKRKSR